MKTILPIINYDRISKSVIIRNNNTDKSFDIDEIKKSKVNKILDDTFKIQRSVNMKNNIIQNIYESDLSSEKFSNKCFQDFLDNLNNKSPSLFSKVLLDDYERRRIKASNIKINKRLYEKPITITKVNNSVEIRMKKAAVKKKTPTFNTKSFIKKDKIINKDYSFGSRDSNDSLRGINITEPNYEIFSIIKATDINIKSIKKQNLEISSNILNISIISQDKTKLVNGKENIQTNKVYNSYI
jgi:hypothetical protein